MYFVLIFYTFSEKIQFYVKEDGVKWKVFAVNPTATSKKLISQPKEMKRNHENIQTIWKKTKKEKQGSKERWEKKLLTYQISALPYINDQINYKQSKSFKWKAEFIRL